MHEHNYTPYKIDEFDDYYYSKCECGSLQGSPITCLEEKQQIINFLAILW